MVCRLHSVQQLLLDAALHAFAKQACRRAAPMRATAAGLEQVFDQHQETGPQSHLVRHVRRKVGSRCPASSTPPNGGLVTMTSTRSFGRASLRNGRDKCVVVDDVGWARRCRAASCWWCKACAADASSRCRARCPLAKSAFVGFDVFILLAQVFNRAGQEAARAAGGVQTPFRQDAG